MKIKSIFFSSIALFLITCTKDKGPVLAIIPATVGECDLANSYIGIIEPIILGNCATSGCHDATSAYGDFSTYEGLKPYIDDGQFKNRVITQKTMPSNGPLSDDQLKKIQCWLDNGAKKSATAATTTITASGCNASVSYFNDIQPIVTTNCSNSTFTGCHESGSANDYTIFANFQTRALNGKLFNRVVDIQDMPMAPVLPLTAIQVRNINCWIQQGALNN